MVKLENHFLKINKFKKENHCQLLSMEELMLLNCGVGEDSWKSLGLQGNQIFNPEINKSTLNIYWKGCC